MAGRALKVASETHENRDRWIKCLRDCISIVVSQTMVHVCILIHLSYLPRHTLSFLALIGLLTQSAVSAFYLDYHLHPYVLFSRYKLLNKVGSGAYGFVVAADDVKVHV